MDIAAEAEPSALRLAQRHALAAFGGADVGELDGALPERIRQYPARGFWQAGELDHPGIGVARFDRGA